MSDPRIEEKIDGNAIGNKYGMFPDNDIRFETTDLEHEFRFGFFANRSNRSVILIKYIASELPAPD